MSLTEKIEKACDLIERIEPTIHALIPEENPNGITRKERLLAKAKDLEDRFLDPKNRPLLFGQLVGIKDIFHVDGFVTRCGSKVPPECFAGEEAVCVTKLREAGALILAKTVTTEFAMLDPAATRNPRNPEHTPGGSSSGSGAAVAADFCPLALGSQTIGSTIRPAAYCGVFGYKPSFERISLKGVVPLAPSLDHVGILDNDLNLAEIAASVLIQDWSALKVNEKPVLGLPTGPYLQQAEATALAHFRGQVTRMVEAGYTIYRVPIFPDIQKINEITSVIFNAEAAQTHHDSFLKYESRYGAGVAKTIRKGRALSQESYDEAKAFQVELKRKIEKSMRDSGVDLWIAPSALGPAPKGLHTTGKPTMNIPWTLAGLPCVSLPVDKIGGMPLGLQLIGRYGEDEPLLHWSTILAKGVFKL